MIVFHFFRGKVSIQFSFYSSFGNTGSVKIILVVVHIGLSFIICGHRPLVIGYILRTSVLYTDRLGHISCDRIGYKFICSTIAV